MNELISIMKIILGSTFALYVKTHGYHWNVEGNDFYQYHELFKSMYEEIWSSVDDIAEKIRQLDAYSPSSMERFIQLSKIESETGNPTSKEMILKLLHDNEILLVLLTEGVDIATKERQHGIANYLASRMEAHGKHRWMLRATAKKITKENTQHG